MPTKHIFALGAVFALALAAGAAVERDAQASSAREAKQQSAQNSMALQAAARGQRAPSSLRSETRLITVDVSVRDKHGEAVRGLKASDFKIFDDGHGPQQIAGFEFIEPPTISATAVASASASQLSAANAKGALSATAESTSTASTSGASAPTTSSSTASASTTAAAKATENSSAKAATPLPVYSNQAFAKLAVPPTAILLDPGNIAFQDQVTARLQALKLLDKLPAQTPVAIFLLAGGLTVVQNFTTDRAILRTAVNRSMIPSDKVKNPESDPDNKFTSTNTGAQAEQEFQKLEYEEQTTVIADETSDAMRAIAKDLSGYPGQKNLVWISEAFPQWILPGSGFGPHSV
ncbi:MAG TPA: hypothetical protein VNK23_01505, partial [Candidatus Dormibacteraeota bacterium]|nr:hypothetical protein [Candidatus Dormibacteraeota bacterium]